MFGNEVVVAKTLVTSINDDNDCCRNEQGEVRLMPKICMLDALERLCQLEEQAFGILIRRRPGKEANHAKED